MIVKVGDIVLVPYPDPGDRRPGVVVRMFDECGQAVVACSSTKVHPEIVGSVCVNAKHPAYKRIGCAADSYFYWSHVVFADYGALTPAGRTSTPTLLLDLRDVERLAYNKRGANVPFVPASAL